MICCGLDIGSTNIKVVLADGEGLTLWVKAVPTPRLNDGLGVATDAATLVTLLEDMVIEGWQALGGREPIAAIAATGVGEDGVLANADLSPRGLVIPWFDKRAQAEAEAFGGKHALTRVTFYTSATKWLWLRQHRADEIAGAAHWIALTDYPSALWCGQPFISETLAARTGCYDVFARAWSDAALVDAKAPPLPRVLKAGQIAGTLRDGRLRQSGAGTTSTIIAAGGHDHPMAAGAIQRLDAAARIDSIGTANAIYGETRNPNPDLGGSELEASVPALGGPGVALIGVTEFSATLRDQLGGDAAIRQLLAVPRLPGAPGAEATDDATRLRHALEQMALKARGYFSALDRAGVPRGKIYATGGWARSTALMELRASIFREPVTVIDEPELAGLAAALLALDAVAGTRHGFPNADRLHVVDPLGRWSEAYAAL